MAQADWHRLCLCLGNKYNLSQWDNILEQVVLVPLARQPGWTKPVPLGLGQVKRDLSLCHGTSHIPTMEAIPCGMAQDLYHDGACTYSTCANLCQKVGLQGRGLFHPWADSEEKNYFSSIKSLKYWKESICSIIYYWYKWPKFIFVAHSNCVITISTCGTDIDLGSWRFTDWIPRGTNKSAQEIVTLKFSNMKFWLKKSKLFLTSCGIIPECHGDSNPQPL